MSVDYEIRDEVILECMDMAKTIISGHFSYPEIFLSALNLFEEVGAYSEQALSIMKTIVISNHNRIWKPKGKYINAYFNMVEEISRDFRKGYGIK